MNARDIVEQILGEEIEKLRQSMNRIDEEHCRKVWVARKLVKGNVDGVLTTYFHGGNEEEAREYLGRCIMRKFDPPAILTAPVGVLRQQTRYGYQLALLLAVKERILGQLERAGSEGITALVVTAYCARCDQNYTNPMHPVDGCPGSRTRKASGGKS